MTETLGYRCPVCGGELQFDSESQKMLCRFCDNMFEVSELSKKDDELETQEEKKKEEWREGEQDGMFVYSCSHCGGEIVGDDTLAATNCPYCDMPVVLKSQFRGDLRPELILPFKLKKEEAVKKLSEFCSGKRLLPDAFTKNNRIETIKGMYVPFWLFDAKSDMSATYDGRKVSTWRSGDYRYTKTDYYEVRRAGYVDFTRVPVDGSVKMSNEYMESIEPFNYDEIVDFQTAYMAGYIADRYDVDESQAKEFAVNRMSNTVKELFNTEAKKGYTTVIPMAQDVNNKNVSARYALLPVWMLSTRYNDKIYTFAMNGQTGKFVGSLPIDKGKQRKYFLSIFSGIAAVGSLLSALLAFVI